MRILRVWATIRACPHRIVNELGLPQEYAPTGFDGELAKL